MMPKTEEKTKNICEGHTKILVCATCKLNILKNPPEAAKVATSVKVFNVGKKKRKHVSLVKILRYNFFQLCRHHHIKGRRNIQSKNLDDGNNNIFFLSEGLAVWAEQKPV